MNEFPAYLVLKRLARHYQNNYILSKNKFKKCSNCLKNRQIN